MIAKFLNRSCQIKSYLGKNNNLPKLDGISYVHSVVDTIQLRAQFEEQHLKRKKNSKKMMKLPNLAFLARISRSYVGKRPLICLGGTVNHSFGVKTIFFNFLIEMNLLLCRLQSTNLKVFLNSYGSFSLSHNYLNVQH